jgi:hypothetical protein
MKTKLSKVYEAVVKVAGNKITRFEAAEVAEVLLKRAAGDVKAATEMASTPYNIGGKLVW